MLLNRNKTKDMWISFCKNSIKPDLLRINDSCLDRVPKFKLLEVWQQDNVSVGTIMLNTRPLLEYASPVWGGLPKYLVDELQSAQNGCLDIIGIPETSLPMLEERRKVATKRELERIRNDKNHPNQIFITKPNTSYSYNLRLVPGPVEVPSSITQRHANSFMAPLFMTGLYIFNLKCPWDENFIFHLFAFSCRI